MSLNQDQINALLAPINPARIQQTQGNSNLEAWDVRRWLLRIFGWGGWDFHVVSCDLVSQISTVPDKPNDKPRHTVVYRVIGRLTIKDANGQVQAVFEDGATGDAINQPSLGDAHDFALKTALSQALKRCAVNLGDQFGLSLYNKGGRAAVVGKSTAHSNTEVHDAKEEVTGGELPSSVPQTGEGDSGAAPRTQVPPAVPTPTDSPSPAAVPPVPTPAGNEADGSAPSPDAAVDALRERVIAAMSLPKKDAIIAFGKLNLEVAKARLQQAPTTTPGGSPTSLGNLIDQALQHVSRPERTAHGVHDDEAGREDVA